MAFQTNFKRPRVIDKVRNHIARRQTVTAEQQIMREVRREDRFCRFPECGCGRLKLTLDVAHAGELGHRGMGGNKSGDRTVPENLILLCRPRHRAHLFAVDKGTLRIEALTDRGLRGPVRWLMWMTDACGLLNAYVLKDLQIDFGDIGSGDLFVLATETAPHVFEPFTPAQAAILKLLGGMEC